jgi:hypothetical protein
MATNNRPVNRLDSQGRAIYDSVDDLAFRGDYDVNNNLTFKGFAKVGAQEDDNVWNLSQIVYDGSNNAISIIWAIDSNNNPNNDYIFSWTNRLSYLYG